MLIFTNILYQCIPAVLPEQRKVKPSFKPPASGRPVSEVKTSPSSPPGAQPEPQTPKGKHTRDKNSAMSSHSFFSFLFLF
jgi:hypothetical protein